MPFFLFKTLCCRAVNDLFSWPGSSESVKMDRLGSMKLNTVFLKFPVPNFLSRYNILNKPCPSFLVKISGFGPSNNLEPRNTLVIFFPGKYCTMTLFSFLSDIAADIDLSIETMSDWAHDEAPPMYMLKNDKL